MAQLRHDGQNDACYKVTSHLWPLVDLDRAHQRFQHISAQRVARALIEGAEIRDINADIGKEANVLSDSGQDATADNLGFERGHLPFGGIRKGTIDMLYYVCANNGVSKKVKCIGRVVHGWFSATRM